MFKKTKVCTSVLVALSGLAALPAFAQNQLERVEITGSIIKRVSAEGALPVTTLTKEDIARTGATSAQDLVALLPSSFGGSVVANNVGATGGASTANLRALGAKYTLVLLNGRRVANFAFGNSPVDLNSIPLSAIERVEVLRDGASAVYGADAVAGVINFILRKDFQGLEINAGEYKSDKVGGNSSNIGLLAGFGDLEKDRFNIMLSASKEEVTPLKAKDRTFGGTARRPDLGINKASARNGVPNLNFTDTLGNKYSGVNPFRFSGCNSTEFALVIIDATRCGTDYVKFIDLIPEQWRTNLVARGVFQADKDNQFYVEAMHNQDRIQSFYSPSPYTKTMSYPAGGRFYPKSVTLPKGMTLKAGYKMPDGSVLAANTVLANDMVVTPNGTSNITGTWRTVAGGGRSDITGTENDRFLIGAKGYLAGWDYDTAFTYSRNKGQIDYGPGKFSYAKLTPLVLAGGINVFGSQDATSLALLNSALITGTQQTAESLSKEVDFKASREIFQMPAGAASLALGASFRKEDLKQKSFPVLETGDEVGGGGAVPSVTGNRKVYGLFGELVIPVMKDLELDVAGRYDSYKNGFGTSFNAFSPKASLSYRPTKDLLLRGSVAKGYRAPTLFENLRPRTTSNNTNANWSDPIRCPSGVPIILPDVPASNPVDRDTECDIQQTTGAAGDANLKPEKSTQFSMGISFAPVTDLITSLDYWNVQIKDPIVFKSEIQVFSDPSKYLDYFYRYNPQTDPDQLNPVKGSTDKNLPISYVFLPYENTAKIYSSGLDFSGQYRMKAGAYGTFGVGLEGTLFITHGYQYTGVNKVSDLGRYKDFGPAPRWRHGLTFTYVNGMVAGSLTNNYTAGYEDYTDPLKVGNTNYPEVRNVKSYMTWDTQLTLRPTKSLEFGLGVKNLLDQDPPSSRTETGFQTGYDASFTNPTGRQFYGKVKYRFF